MNNKGFAITTILYGTLILFLMLLLSLLGILTSYKDKLSILIDRTGAARDIINSARFLYVEHIKKEEPEEDDYIKCETFSGTHVHIEYYDLDDEDGLSCENEEPDCELDEGGICIVESCSYTNYSRVNITDVDYPYNGILVNCS